MSDRSNDKPGLSADDAAIWNRVSKTVTPIAADRPRLTVPDVDPGQKPRPRKALGNQVKPSPKISPLPQPGNTPPRLTGLDRRTRQKLTRGNVEIEARLDLHGLTQSAARSKLAGYLNAAQASGIRTVLVITGKGRSPYGHHTLHGHEHVPTPERTGVLRNAVADWLKQDEFRAMVLGFQPAHPKHGGGGAFYIKLRRRRDRIVGS